MSKNYAAILRSIRAAGDERIRKDLMRVVPGATTVGVSVPRLRELVKEFKSAHPEMTVDSAADLMDELCGKRVREEILFGSFLLARFGKKVSSVSWERLRPWADSLDNWETCDQLASNVSGEVVAANPELVAELGLLAASANPWKRRFALATTVAMNHKGRSFSAETLRICRMLLSDSDPNVKKALGWALRELSSRAEPQVFEFLMKSTAEMPVGLLRQASQKLTAEHRETLLSKASSSRS
jgi:3-methyladenine DNA glycosylase AlkD